jgi:hypothetical protein
MTDLVSEAAKGTFDSVLHVGDWACVGRIAGRGAGGVGGARVHAVARALSSGGVSALRGANKHA